MTLDKQINQMIDFALKNGGTDREIFVFPYGNVGKQVCSVLEEVYGIVPKIVDNYIGNQYDRIVYTEEVFDHTDCERSLVLLSCINEQIFCELKRTLLRYFPSSRIYELDSMRKMTICGKYTNAKSLIKHELVEIIGSFCNIHQTVDVVHNHPLDLV